ncbi:aminoglycoside 6-adenylyltransferase [Aneurinibacillus migulanus]|uniref:Aminoglycoside 6-adenylyltransferase n=1 Tax=Aneurinibacillus migulanus TaxID=47500 RepID=A0A0D1XH22_ANEMI|nr:aminoglycoside 6-adenylyltransferase [Aneurinibacillus migulanus]KIV51558.1 aminoglycoside adenylyltransferase [Aneurinibacillus migulanus]KON97546.1 aminoglycoside adenylyltransferase [Aneurinibacillus migulanus]MED0894141.1 aminoglycoside 6-adenylyltransferase [Aneurinibacillus migulanus]MED1619673.1 aminoglycoside 6-adenylyltransferase [Aneurinibacillus migulanus]SDK10580.1 aminoglycoside 6-adenylyltransferase [Aneurinibacillus migulanus]
MRTEREMMDMIMATAEEDARIRAVIMNGSRTNITVNRDCFQDYDIVYVVDDIESFISNHRWVDQFGDRIIMQMPEDMILPPAEEDGNFPYLMLFTDGKRLDLTLVPIENADELIDSDSLSMLLLDKDNRFEPFPPSSDDDYWIEPPTAKQFSDCCNEFWWCSTNVAKGLWRKELPFVKMMLEESMRNMLHYVLEWRIGINTQFSVSAGKYGKYFEKYLEEQAWNELKATYSNSDYANIWDSFFAMCSLFRNIAVRVADHFGYEYPYDEDRRVTAYLRHVQLLPEDATEIY